MANPFKAVMNIRRDELPLSLLMFSYFFLVITSFWVLKPLKKSIFIGYYDKIGFDLSSWHLTASQAELLAKVLNMVVAYIAVVVFTWLASKFRRQQLTFIFSGFFIVCYLIFSLMSKNIADLTVWSFYLFGDLFSTLMVATFFVFLNDSVTSDSAKRLYGLIGLGGVTGGAFGSLAVRAWINQLTISSWLMICLAMAVLIIVIAKIVGDMVARNPALEKSPTTVEAPPESSGNPAFEGAKLVFRSRYLLAIVAIVGLYEIVSTIMDFQFTSTISYYLDGDALKTQFATVYAFTNVVALVVQLFLTSFIMTRFGLKTALIILPLMIIAGSFLFIALPILWVGSLLNTADNGFSYSINQSAKEVLYVPTTREEKYKAKAFIDMFVQRFAKAIAVGLSLGITTIFTSFAGIRWLSLFTLAIVAIWILAALYAGRKFHEMT